MNSPLRAERNTLFEEVWTEPMSKLSKRYGISDVGLAKICRRMDIPVPPRGYWARIAHGQKITIPSLPTLKIGTPESIAISPPSEHTLFTKAIYASLEEPADATEEIIVDEVLTKPHPLIRAAEKSLKKSQPDTYGRLTTSNGDIDVRVGRSSIPRAMLIMDAVMKAFDARGYTVKFKEDYGLGSYVIVDGQSIPFSLDAASKRFDIPASQQKDSWSPKVEYTATEKLRFRIQGTIFAADRVDLPLEKQLRAVMKAIVAISVSLREHDEAIKKQHALWEEQARARREAETLQKKLFEDIENWSKSERIRGFIARLTSELEKNPAAKTDYAERWLLWAGDHLAHLDPFSGGLKEFFEHYQQNEWSSVSRRR